MPESHMPDEMQTRVLQWLDAFPFQRLEDLVLALSPWRGRTAVYTSVRELERVRLVETLETRLSPGKRLYHLAPAGSFWCRTHLKPHTPDDSAPGSAHTAREVLAEERLRHLHLLPRLPVLLRLQTTVNELVSGAAAALTRQGHRASLVRWNWQRDAIHRFTYQGRPARWFADGVGAFRLRFVTVSGTMREEWYRFFLL